MQECGKKRGRVSHQSTHRSEEERISGMQAVIVLLWLFRLAASKAEQQISVGLLPVYSTNDEDDDSRIHFASPMPPVFNMSTVSPPVVTVSSAPVNSSDSNIDLSSSSFTPILPVASSVDLSSSTAHAPVMTQSTSGSTPPISFSATSRPTSDMSAISVNPVLADTASIPTNSNKIDQQPPVTPRTNPVLAATPANPRLVATPAIPFAGAGNDDIGDNVLLDQEECFVRSCDQLIAGRGLDYQRALEIVQEEEYLTEADLGIIRREWRLHNIRPEKKVPLDLDTKSASVDAAKVTPIRIKRQNTMLANNTMVINLSVGAGSPSAPGLGGVSPVVAGGAILLGAAALILISQAAGVAAPVTASVSQAPSVAQQPITQQQSSMQQAQDQVPPNQPQPGTFGGGGLPAAASALAAEALALVPPGLTAIAIFPPFRRARTVDAVCVIFSEASEAQSLTGGSHARRQDTWSSDNFLSKVWHLIMGSLRGTLTRHDSLERQNYGTNFNSGKGVQNTEERRYGFRCRIRTTKLQRCIREKTCPKTHLHRLTRSLLHNRERLFSSRQTGEEFSSEAPPDCRTEFVPCN